MATENWPTTLPACPQQWAEQDAEVILRTDTDDPATVKKRRLFSRTVSLVTCSLTLNKTLYYEFMIFYRQTLRNGLDSFYYTHPYTGAQMVFEFINPPAMTMQKNAFNVTMNWRQVII